MRVKAEEPRRVFLYLRIVGPSGAAEARAAGQCRVAGAKRRPAPPCLSLLPAPDDARAEAIWLRVLEVCGDYASHVRASAEAHEASLDLTRAERLRGSAVEIGRELRNRLRGELGLEAAVGLGPNAAVARLASRCARAGDVVDVPPRRAVEFVSQLPVSHLPGVDGEWARWLRDMGIETAGDLAALSAESVARTFGERGSRLWAIARAEDPDTEPSPATPPAEEGEEVAAQVGLRPATDDRLRLSAALRIAAEEVAAGLRQQGKAARQIRLELVFDDLRRVEVRRTLPCPTRSSRAVWLVARALADHVRLQHRLVRRARVRATCLALDEHGGQLQLPLPRREEGRPQRRRPGRPNAPTPRPDLRTLPAAG